MPESRCRMRETRMSGVDLDVMVVARTARRDHGTKRATRD